MSDRLAELRRLIATAIGAIRTEVDDHGRDAEASQRLARIAQDAGAAVEAVASSIVIRGAKTHEDLVCLAEIARFDARLDFAGPPALDLDDPGDKVLLALMNGVVRLLPGEGAH